MLYEYLPQWLFHNDHIPSVTALPKGMFLRRRIRTTIFLWHSSCTRASMVEVTPTAPPISPHISPTP